MQAILAKSGQNQTVAKTQMPRNPLPAGEGRSRSERGEGLLWRKTRMPQTLSRRERVARAASGERGIQLRSCSSSVAISSGSGDSNTSGSPVVGWGKLRRVACSAWRLIEASAFCVFLSGIPRHCGPE